MKPSVRTPALFEGKIDFFSGTRGGSIPRMEIIAERQGRKAQHLSFKDMGIETTGHVIQTHEDRIKQNPDQVRRFSRSLRCMGLVFKNPTEALEIFVKANPELDRHISRAQDGAGACRHKGS